MFLCDGAKIDLSRAAGLTICILMHEIFDEINISVIVDSCCWFLSLKSTLLMLIAFVKCNLNSTAFFVIIWRAQCVCFLLRNCSLRSFTLHSTSTMGRKCAEKSTVPATSRQKKEQKIKIGEVVITKRHLFAFSTETPLQPQWVGAILLGDIWEDAC